MIIQKLYREFVGLYLSNLSLPMVFKPSSKVTVVFILVMVILSILFNLGLYKNFNSSITYLLVCGSIFNLFYLIFNLIVRFYNVFYKSINYFYSVYKEVGFKNCNKVRVLIFYYSYNILCFILTYFLIVRIQNNLFDFNYFIGEYSQIYSYAISPVLALMYIDYISEDSVLYKQVLLNKFGKIMHFIIIGLIVWSLLAVITNLVVLKPILCDTTGSDNNQVNQNTQNGDYTNNEQRNGNNQVTHLDNNTPSSSRNYNNNQRQIVQTNSQGNVNNQIFKGKTPNLGVSNSISTDSNGFSIQIDRQLNINNQTISNDLTESNIAGKNISLLQKGFDIRTFSFMEAYEALRDLKIYNLISETQYKNNLYYLLNYAFQQDTNSNYFLFVYKEDLLENQNNFNNILRNQLIYMNGKYSVILFDSKTETYVTLNQKGYNLALLFENNISHENYSIKHLEGLKLKFKAQTHNFIDTAKEIKYVRREIRACRSLENLLLDRFLPKIEKIYLNKNAMSDLLTQPNIVSYLETRNNLIYWKNLDLFTYGYCKEYDIIPVNSRVKLFNFAYLDYLRAKNESIFYGDHNILYYDRLLEALRKDIPGLDVSYSDNKIAPQMEEPLNCFNIFNFDRLDKTFPSNPPSVKEIEVTSRWSVYSNNSKSNIVDNNKSKLTFYNTFRKAVFNVFRGKS